MKKLFELPEADFMKLQFGDHQTLTELGKEYGFKPETVEFTGGNTNQFFAEKAVRELEPITIGDMNPETFTAVQLAKFSYKVADLQKKADEYSKLEVKDVDDKEGLKKLSRARIELKGDVAGIRKAGKQLREFSNSYNKAVIAREDELAGIIEPVRDALQKRENEIEEEKERIRLEAERLEDLRIQGMIDKLASVGHAADYSQIKAITDEAFEELLTEAINIHNEKVKRDQEEADRLRLEKEKEERERKEEAERLEKQRKQQDEENRKIAAQQEQIREQQESLRKQKAAIEEEKQKIRNAKIDAIVNRLKMAGAEHNTYTNPPVIVIRSVFGGVQPFQVDDLADLADSQIDQMVQIASDFTKDQIEKERQRKEQAKKEEEERIAREKQEAIDKALRDKEEQERKTKEEAEEKAAAASDHDKLVALANAMDGFAFPNVKSNSGSKIVEHVKLTLAKEAIYIRDNMFSGGPEAL